MDSKVFVCFVLVEDRYGLVLEGNVLVFEKYSKGRGVTFCVVRVASEDAFIDAKSHTCP